MVSNPLDDHKLTSSLAVATSTQIWIHSLCPQLDDHVLKSSPDEVKRADAGATFIFWTHWTDMTAVGHSLAAIDYHDCVRGDRFDELFHRSTIITYQKDSGMELCASPVDISGTVVGESPDCLLLFGTVVGENPDHVCWDQNIYIPWAVPTLPSSYPEHSHSDQNDHGMSLLDVFIFVFQLL